MSAWERALQGGGGGSLGTAVRRAQARPPAPRFVPPTAGLGPGFRPTNQDYASAGRMAGQIGREILFGPERASVITSGQASLPERFARDWFAAEQERNLAAQAARENRPGAAIGWGALAAASVVPAGRIGRALRTAGNVAEASADVSRITPPISSVSEAFPGPRLDELLDRTAVQMDIPVEYTVNPRTGMNETLRGPSRTFGSDANRVEAQIYRTPSGNWIYGSPHDVTIRTPLLASDVGFRSRNPFEATGTSPLAIGADDLMGDYVSAVIAARRAGVPTTDIDALLYLLREGNPAAGNLFEGIARSGPRVPFLNATTSPSLDDIVLVHSRGTPARMDARGNALLWAGGDFRTGSYVPIGSSNRNSYMPWRGSLHFSQNARVAEAPLAGSWADNRNYVLSRLNDVIEANPGSLGNLNPADTYFFPRPGRPLILPNARTIEVPAAPTGYNPNQKFPQKTILLEDGTTTTIGGQSYYKPNAAYEELVNDIIGQNVNEMGGRFLGIAGEDFPFPQRDVLSSLQESQQIPLFGHARGSIPGYSEQEAIENFYRAGLGIEDSLFDSALHNMLPSTSQWEPPPQLDATEFWRRILSGNNLTGGTPVRFDPFESSGFNF